MKYTVILLLTLACMAFGQRVTYDGYKVFRTQHLNMTTSKLLQELQGDNRFDFWKDPVIGRSADIMVSPEMISTLQEILAENEIHYTTMIEDVEALHNDVTSKRSLSNLRRSGYDWKDYYRHDDINRFIDELASTNSDFINTVSIGKTVEDRDMRVIQITKAGSDAPIAWIEAGV